MWDCDDTRSDINPGMTERCDWFDLDEDCDGEINEPGALDGTIFYRDYDGDGFGDPFESEMLCEAGDITYYDATDNSDCCDWDPGANPSADSARTIPTTCGDFDWDCDGNETKSLTEMGDCGWGLSLDSCSAEPEGWESSIPDCGEEEDWIRNCEVTYSWGIPSCNREVTTPETQPCL